MELDKEELEETRRLNGADTKIVIRMEALERKLEELQEQKNIKKSDYDDEQYYFMLGKIEILKALKEGRFDEI